MMLSEEDKMFLSAIQQLTTLKARRRATDTQTETTKPIETLSAKNNQLGKCSKTVDKNCYRIEVETIGIAPKDVFITLENGSFHVTGKTTTKNINYFVDFFVDVKTIVTNYDLIERVEYTSENGITYIYLYTKEKKSTIDIKRI